MATKYLRNVLITFIFALHAGSWQAHAAGNNGRWAEGHILVQPKTGLSDTEFTKLLTKAGAKSRGRRIQQIDVHIVPVNPRAEDAVVKALSHHKHINFAEKDMAVALNETTASDPHFGDAWHLHKMQSPAAWDNALGNGITVAVLDTGVDPYHVDLTGKLVTGWNAVDGSSITTDVKGHGTQVAGVIGATSDNGIGVTSLAWNASIMPIRVSNSSDGVAYTSHIASGLTWAADHGATVANISYSVTNSSTVSNAAQYMMSKGGVVVVSAGNSGNDPGYSDSPYMLSVSATNSNDVITSWSSFGNYIDVSAPGATIWTTRNGGSYGTVSGTSFSSPATAAVVALMQSVNPDLTPDTTMQLVMDTSDDLGNAGWDTKYGHGRVNANAAVSAAMVADTVDTQSPTVQFSTPGAGESVSGIVDVSVTAQDNNGVTKVDLLANGSLVASDVTTPYSFSWDSMGETDGQATLVAYAYDAAGNRGSRSLSIDVSNGSVDDSSAPAVSITSPSDGTSISGTVSINASASDDSGVSQLQILVDGALRCATDTNRLSCSWNTRKVSSGNHTITAQATDPAGNRGNTSIVVVKGSGGNTRKGGGGDSGIGSKGKGKKK